MYMLAQFTIVYKTTSKHLDDSFKITRNQFS